VSKNHQNDGHWRRTGRALRHPNYRLFFAGQIISLCGTWMTNVATAWLVYRMTNSAFMLGVVTFSTQIPAFLLGPFAGMLGDRVDKRRALVATQTLSMLQSFALAAITLSGHATIELLIALTFLKGVILAFDIPVRQSFLVDMIEDRGDLANAIALNSSMFNAARLVGPALGAAVITAFGEGWCFFLDGCSFLAVLASLLMMKLVARRSPVVGAGLWSDLLAGWRIVGRPGPIRRIMALLAVVSLLGASYATLIPVFAGQILQGGPQTLGLLMGSSGAGALLGATWLAGRRSVLGLGSLIPCATGLFGLSIIGFALSRLTWLSMIFLFAGGLGLMVQMAASNTILQTIVGDTMRSRVMSFYMMAFLGTAPFGSLLMGSMSERFGPTLAIALGGVSCLVGAGVFFSGLEQLRESIRPIYRRMGILPELANAEEAASRIAFQARE